jgi:hypothetical protein
VTLNPEFLRRIFVLPIYWSEQMHAFNIWCDKPWCMYMLLDEDDAVLPIVGVTVMLGRLVKQRYRTVFVSSYKESNSDRLKCVPCYSCSSVLLLDNMAVITTYSVAKV